MSQTNGQNSLNNSLNKSVKFENLRMKASKLFSSNQSSVNTNVNSKSGTYRMMSQATTDATTSYRVSTLNASPPGNSFRLAMSGKEPNEDTESKMTIDNSFLNTTQRRTPSTTRKSRNHNFYLDDLGQNETIEIGRREKYLMRMNSERYEKSEEKVTVL